MFTTRHASCWCVHACQNEFVFWCYMPGRKHQYAQAHIAALMKWCLPPCSKTALRIPPDSLSAVHSVHVRMDSR